MGGFATVLFYEGLRSILIGRMLTKVSYYSVGVRTV
jgi:hypothetical protein